MLDISKDSTGIICAQIYAKVAVQHSPGNSCPTMLCKVLYTVAITGQGTLPWTLHVSKTGAWPALTSMLDMYTSRADVEMVILIMSCNGAS